MQGLQMLCNKYLDNVGQALRKAKLSGTKTRRVNLFDNLQVINQLSQLLKATQDLDECTTASDWSK